MLIQIQERKDIMKKYGYYLPTTNKCELVDTWEECKNVVTGVRKGVEGK